MSQRARYGVLTAAGGITGVKFKIAGRGSQAVGVVASVPHTISPAVPGECPSSPTWF